MTASPDCDAVLAANRAFYRAFEKKDIAAMEDVWTTGSAARCIHPGRGVLKGWPAVRQSWLQIFQATEYLELDTEGLEVEVVGRLGYVVLVESILQISGRQRLQAKSMATNLFEKLGDRWYLIHHHGSPLIR